MCLEKSYATNELNNVISCRLTNVENTKKIMLFSTNQMPLKAWTNISTNYFSLPN